MLVVAGVVAVVGAAYAVYFELSHPPKVEYFYDTPATKAGASY